MLWTTGFRIAVQMLLVAPAPLCTVAHDSPANKIIASFHPSRA